MTRSFFRGLAAVLILAWALTAPAFGAVTANSVVTPQTPGRILCQFLQGTDTAGTYKTCYTGGANGSKCSALWETNNDGSATHLITAEIVNGGVNYGGVAVTTVSNDGYSNGVPAKNFLSAGLWPGLPTDSDANAFFYLANGDTLKATYATALTSGKWVSLVGVCADY